MYIEDTIVAVATPPGTGGLAVLRVSGPAALAVADKAFRPGRPGAPLPSQAPSHSVHHGHVVHEGMVGTPAIVADFAGKGRVLLISPHPESHEPLDVLVARAIGWTLGVEPAKVARKAGAAAR